MRRCREDGTSYLNCVWDVVEKIKNTPHSHLVLVSVIPSPCSNDTDKYLFKYVDEEMKNYANQSGGKVSFLNLNKNFITGNTINMDYYDQRENEPVHLSEKGASMVAETLKNFLAKLNNNKWD